MKLMEMKFTSIVLLKVSVLLTLGWGFGGMDSAVAQDEIFNSKNFEGWEHDDSHWRIEDGTITGEIPDGEVLRRNLFLFWKGEVFDFDLRLQFKVSGHPSANSGVQYRSKKSGHGSATGYQADLDDGAVWMGRIYDEHGRALIGERGVTTVIDEKGKRRSTVFRPAGDYKKIVKKGEWNDYRVRAIGPRMETYINGELACALIDNEVAQLDFSGKLALQLHSGPGPAKIQFRNLRLKHLGKTTPPKRTVVREKEREGEVPKGKDGKPLNLGFESGTFKDWKVEGELWKNQKPTHGDTVTPRRPGQASQHAGEYWVGGYERTHSDKEQGILESVPFKVTHPFGSFLVGGGPSKETCVEIVEAKTKKLIHRKSGAQLENLEPHAVNLKDYMGKEIIIRVVDKSSGPWGHVNYDDFRFHNELSETLQVAGLPGRMRQTPLLRHLKKNPAEQNLKVPGALTVANTYVPEGFQADLIASEPNVRQPIAFCFDAKGRLWIAEAFSYPQRRPDAEARDRIIILEDKDADGKFESHKVFTDTLNLVSGLAVGHGGVWVGAAPYLLFIPDANRDDVPDGKPQVLLDGWGYQDTHETLNSFTWGPDGWLYGNHGVFNLSYIGKPGAQQKDRIEFRAGVWRYHPQRHEFEIFAHGGSNQWGLDFDLYGELYMTHCRSFWGRGSTTHVIWNGHFWNQANSNHAPFVSGHHPRGLSHMRNFLLASARYGHGEGGAGARGSRALYGGHSHVGTMIYLGDNWPPEYRNHLYSHNLHGHQINRQFNVRRESGYETLHAGQDTAFVDDPKYVAVDLKYGPDGSVYIIDWVDQQHCHSPHMERWDRSNGRVYRIQYTSTFKPKKVDLTEESDEALLAYLKHPNAWYWRVALRQFQERKESRSISVKVQAELKKALNTEENIEIKLRALWGSLAVGSLKQADLTQLLQSAKNEHLRFWALRLFNEVKTEEKTLLAALKAAAQKDNSSRVRLGLASYLPELSSEARWQLAEALASRFEDQGDRYIPKMVWYGIADLVQKNVDRGLQLAQKTSWVSLKDYIQWYGSKTPEGLNQLIGTLPKRSLEEKKHLLNLITFGIGTQGTKMPKNWESVAQPLYESEDGHLQALSEVLGARFGHEVILDQQRSILASTASSKSKRRRAFDILKNFNDPKSLPVFLKLIDEKDYRSTVITLLGRYDDPKIAPTLLNRFAKLSKQDQFRAIDALTSRPALSEQLLMAVSEAKISKESLTSFHLRKMRGFDHPQVSKLIKKLWGDLRSTPQQVQAKIKQLAKDFKEAPLWAYSAHSGYQTFTKTCQNCHSVNGKGGNLGPDLAGSGRNGPEYFLENVLDPNAVVGEDYQSTRVITKNGEVLSGLVRNPKAEVISIQTLTETREIKQSDILNIEKQSASVMPEGLFDTLSKRQIIELLKYLNSLR